MSWEMLAALGQLAAVLVGIPSLIYLAVQIREQTKERRQSAVHALTVQWGDLTGSLHDNPETAAIFLRGMHSFIDLDAAQINAALGALQDSIDHVRTVIVPSK